MGLLLSLLLLGGLVGCLLGGLPLGLFVAAVTFGLWAMVQTRKLLRWVREDYDIEPPESYGTWGEVLDGIYRLQKLQASERQRLRDEAQHLKDSLASIDDAAIILNAQHEIDWFNTAAERLLGLRYPGDIGQVLVNLLRDPAFISYFEGGDYREVLQIASPIDDEIKLECHTTLFGEGNHMVFVRNVTEMKRLEQMRTDFIANVSHELRTPLTVINGYLEAMLDTGSEWQAAYEQMHGQAQRMERLLTDLTQLTRLESVPEKWQQSQLAVRSLIGSMFDEISLKKPGQKLEMRIEDNVELLGNYDEIYSAFSNLINNASKYSPDDAKISVLWHAKGDGARLVVRDTGLGIEPQHISRLTERFYRTDASRDSQTGGTGLGLAIVKHVLLRHQAGLQIKSEPGKGSEFICEFPPEHIVRRSVQGEAELIESA
jgi:two-component system phosphate regulon sensor histidine kinase PhoR